MGAYWKGTLTPKATSAYAQQTMKKINYRGISIYRIQNGKMVETWHVVDDESIAGVLKLVGLVK